jgi:hypothetical protein
MLLDYRSLLDDLIQPGQVIYGPAVQPVHAPHLPIHGAGTLTYRLTAYGRTAAVAHRGERRYAIGLRGHGRRGLTASEKQQQQRDLELLLVLDLV